jgi:hypothetical protein
MYRCRDVTMSRCIDVTQFCNDLCIGHNVAMIRDTFVALWCLPIHAEPTGFAVIEKLTIILILKDLVPKIDIQIFFLSFFITFFENHLLYYFMIPDLTEICLFEISHLKIVIFQFL